MSDSQMKATRHIYVIGSPSGPFKIGIATNLKGRLSSIQTGSPVKVSVIHVVIVPREDAISVEGHAHKLLHAHRMSGEWFNVSSEDAKGAVIRAVSFIAKEARKRVRAENARRKRERREAAERVRADNARMEMERREAEGRDATRAAARRKALDFAMQVAVEVCGSAGVPKSLKDEYMRFLRSEARKAAGLPPLAPRKGLAQNRPGGQPISESGQPVAKLPNHMIPA